MISPAIIVPMLPLLVKKLRESDDVDIKTWAVEAGDAVREYIPEPDVVDKLATMCELIAENLRGES